MTASAERTARRLFSASGVLPLGVFVLIHLAVQARALAGPAAFEKTAELTSRAPFVLEVLFVAVPLAFHAAYGTYLAIKGISLRDRSPYPPALARAMRVTGLLALAYVGFHVYAYAGAISPVARYTLIASRLSTATATFPLGAVVEVCGEGVVLFHFCVGLWGASVSRGWAASQSARRWSAVAFSAIGAAAFLVAFDTIVLFSTGARLFGRNDSTPLELEPSEVACPPSAAPSSQAR